MNCKHCNAQLEEDVKVCPVCGKEQESFEELSADIVEEVAEDMAPAEAVAEEVPAAEEPKKDLPFQTDFEAPAKTEIKEGVKATPGKIALAVVAGVVVLAILVALVVNGLGTMSDTAEPTAAPTEEIADVAVAIPFDGNPESPLCKASYSVSDEELAAAADTVVATMGDKVLTNGELQAYYWHEINAFLQEYGSYLAYIGLDAYTPLDQQISEVGEQTMSWQQFFLDSAIYSWMNSQSMALEAEAANYVMPADRQAELDSLAADLDKTAQSAGLADADALIKDRIGAGCSLEHYLRYTNVYYQGQSYYFDCVEALAPTVEEVDAFFAENEEYYTGSGITRDSRYVDVRHVLLQPEGGETDENGYPVFTEEAWAACLQKAEEIYGQWQEGDLSEESFAQLAVDHSVDGNASSGGLYQNVCEGQMVEEFENWCFNEGHQVGDHGIVKTVYGYHIMYFSGVRDIAEYDLIGELAYEMVPAAIEKYPASVDYSAIKLWDLKLA